MAGYDSGCRGKAWIGGAIAGLAVFFWVLAVAGFGFGAAVFLGVLTFLFFGATLVWGFCIGADLTFHEAPQGFEVPDIPAPIVPVPEPTPAPQPMPVAVVEPPEVVAEEVVSAARASLAEAAPVEEAPVAEPAPEEAAAEAERKAARAARRKARAEAAAAAEVAAAPAAETDPAAEAERKAARAARRKARFEAQARAEAEAAAAETEAEPETAEPVEPVGTRPAGLAAPRDGQADELRLIEGIGPKLEEVLHRWGIFHFDQIAGWGPAEVAFADTHVPRFKGRCSRDKWVAQAKIIVEEGVDAFLERAKTNDY